MGELERHIQALFCLLFHYTLHLFNSFAAIVSSSHITQKNIYIKQPYAATENL